MGIRCITQLAPASVGTGTALEPGPLQHCYLTCGTMQLSWHPITAQGKNRLNDGASGPWRPPRLPILWYVNANIAKQQFIQDGHPLNHFQKIKEYHLHSKRVASGAGFTLSLLNSAASDFLFSNKCRRMVSADKTSSVEVVSIELQSPVHIDTGTEPINQCRRPIFLFYAL